MYTLYDHPYSQHARRVRALLEIAELPYELKHMDLLKGEHMSEEFLAISPNHQVPVLVDGELKLQQSNAILRYLCNKHGLDYWYPTDHQKRAIVDQWLDWTQCRMSPAVINIVLYTVFMTDGDHQKLIDSGHETMKELSGILDKTLSENDYLIDDMPTIADVAIASNITQLGLANATPIQKNIQNWMARMNEIPGIKITLEAMKM